jgi:Domain of unknown function (DUF4410)
MALLTGDRSHSCLTPPSPTRLLHHAISAPVLSSGVPAPNCVRYEANAVKHISYLLAATLAVAFLTSRQGCAQDATKRVPTEPAPATSAAPVKTHPAHGEANVQRYACGAVRDSEGCDISSGVSGADANGNLQGTDQKVFAEAATEGQTATPDAHLLRLTGLITNYNPGNRAKRHFGVGAAGAAEIDSKVSFVDATTGHTLMSQDLRAVLAVGFFGGKSEDAVKGYARRVVTRRS